MSGALQYSPKVVGERLKHRYFKAVPAGAGPFYSVYECADGQWLQLGCIHSEFIDQAAAAMDIADVMVDPKFGDGRFPKTEEARQELSDIVERAMRSKPYDDWVRLFEEVDVPYARSCTTREAFDNPQVRVNEMVLEVEDPEVGVMLQMGVPIKLPETPGRVRGPRPLPGEHSDRVLAALSEEPCVTPDAAPSNPEPLNPPLKGVKVMEVANVLAGPAVGRMLSDLGADVTKLETLLGDISRAANTPGFYYLNGNKRSISVDMRTLEGKDVARRLAAQADVLVANLRPGATERMGLGTEVLKRLNPGLIETHVTAYGWTGPYAHKPGLDPLAQAMIGLQRAQGGEGQPPVFLA
jgi:crotonobetainyl-CoA:carnitine CoA-transferase CaiB-like acyl-CoA transferase